MSVNVCLNSSTSNVTTMLMHFMYMEILHTPSVASCSAPHKGAQLTQDELHFNTCMSRVRKSVEWGFGKILTNSQNPHEYIYYYYYYY